MSDWPLYDPKKPIARAKVALPAPPPWRQPGKARHKVAAATFRPSVEVVEAMNTALFLRRPLLLTGKPGTGKSSLIYSVAAKLKLGPVLTWSIHSRSTLQEGLYHYDALARLQRLQEQELKGAAKGGDEASELSASSRARWRLRAVAAKGEDEASELSAFLSLGPLGAALGSPNAPRALLIDEIDKSDIDLPNDLLNVLDTGSFTIRELERLAATHRSVQLTSREGETVTVKRGVVEFAEFPVIVMTSNGERDFPAPFLRRCVQCEVAEPGEAELQRIVQAHFRRLTAPAQRLIKRFLKERAAVALATDQALNAIHLLDNDDRGFSEADEERLLKILLHRLEG